MEPVRNSTSGPAPIFSSFSLALPHDKALFAETIEPVINELNVLHPFREGNGRLIRYFFLLIFNDWKNVYEILNVTHHELSLAPMTMEVVASLAVSKTHCVSRSSCERLFQQRRLLREFYQGR